MPLYAEAFEDAGALDRLEGFASVHGAAFYGLPRNGDTITLAREPGRCRTRSRSVQRRIVPLRAGETLRWSVADGRSGAGAAYNRRREAGQIVAASGAIPRERKVRAPQSGMPGNARPQ